MKFEVQPGENIYEVCKRAVLAAHKSGRETQFEFNQITLYAQPTSDPFDIVTIYGLKCEIERLKNK